ncbi:DNA alkylation repair protein [Candidatus Ruminimicrobium bovinum]|uniref:DNA alkylation repair protein n=1 Tax=Candidatus Ruminimicrobium bovinum TaxID=3242779 RepID=UPI0039B9C5E0
MYEKIRQDLLNLQDKKYQQFHRSLCPGTNNIIGVRIPVLRAYAKKLSKQENFKEYISFNETVYYEEIMLQGMLIGFIKNADITELLPIIKNFILKIDNWAVCDIFCSGLKTVNKNKETVWKFIRKYLKSKKEFELRFAIVMMLDYFIDEKYIKDVLNIFDTVKHNGYYVKMAVAWAISAAFVKFPQITMIYLKKSNLDIWTYNKTLQKITESLRVSPKTKEIIKKMKR